LSAISHLEQWENKSRLAEIATEHSMRNAYGTLLCFHGTGFFFKGNFLELKESLLFSKQVRYLFLPYANFV
jgi:hypothetical protein